MALEEDKSGSNGGEVVGEIQINGRLDLIDGLDFNWMVGFE